MFLLKSRKVKKKTLWFTLSNELGNVERDIVCAVVYIPPNNSTNATEESYVEIQVELNVFSRSYESVYACLAILIHELSFKYYILLDTELFESQHLNNIADEYELEIYRFDSSFNVNKLRVSCDQSSNSYGIKVTEFLNFVIYIYSMVVLQMTFLEMSLVKGRAPSIILFVILIYICISVRHIHTGNRFLSLLIKRS